MASLDLGDGSPTSVLSGVAGFISKPNTELVTLISSFIFGTFASVYLGVVRIINAVVTFITAPFISAGEAIGALFGGLLTSPVRILETTAQTSGAAISEQFGWLAFPVGAAIILLVLWMITQYREQQETGDTIVGLPFDVPDVGPFQIGTTEENEDEQ